MKWDYELYQKKVIQVKTLLDSIEIMKRYNNSKEHSKYWETTFNAISSINKEIALMTQD